MKNPKLKQEYNDRFRNDYAVLDKIGKAVGRSAPTIQRWFYENNEMLTLAAVLQVLSDETGVSPSELIEESENVTA
jgi:hypothetical protein